MTPAEDFFKFNPPSSWISRVFDPPSLLPREFPESHQSGGGVDFFWNNPMIPKMRVIGSIIDPEISTKMLRNWREKLKAEFPSTTFGYSMVRIFRLNNMLSQKFCNWKQAQKEVNNCSKQIRKQKAQKILKNWKTSIFDFCACPNKNVLKRDASGKKGMLSGCKFLFE